MSDCACGSSDFLAREGEPDGGWIHLYDECQGCGQWWPTGECNEVGAE